MTPKAEKQTTPSLLEALNKQSENALFKLLYAIDAMLDDALSRQVATTEDASEVTDHAEQTPSQE